MIFVTGGSGLLGQELISQLLQEGHKVIATEHRTPINITHSNLIIEKGDLLNVVWLETLLSKVSGVFHCAGYVSFSTGDRDKLFRINTACTTALVNACIECKVSKLVHVSSVAALQRSKTNEAIDEKLGLVEEKDTSVYGYSKFLGEMEVWRGIAEGLNAVIVNPSIILGAGNWEEGSTKLFKNVWEEFPYYTEGATGFVDVKDVAAAMILLMNADITNERFVLNGHNIAYRELFTKMAIAFGKKPPHKLANTSMINAVVGLGKLRSFFTRKPPLITLETAKSAVSVVQYDNNKILKALPKFNFRPIDVTVNETVNALKQRYHL